MPINLRKIIIRQLALSVLNGDHSAQGINHSLSQCLDIPEEATLALANEIHEYILFEAYPARAYAFLISWLEDSIEFNALYDHELRVRRWPLQNGSLPSIAGQPTLIDRWKLPIFEDSDAFAAWCELDSHDLIWFAQRYQSNTPPPTKIDHYQYNILAKSNGEPRLIEAPKERLKQIQRKIHSAILSNIPVHNAAHGFVKQKSIKTFVDPHVARPVVIAMDLQHFFMAISAGRIYRMFQKLGYSEEISTLLKGLCTHATPETYINRINDSQEKKRLRAEHLPQGAATSPTLANIAAFNLDVRVSAAAQSLGFEYTRYADDMAFSSENFNASRNQRLINLVTRIAQFEGFAINKRKTRIMTQAQRQKLVGIVINEKMNIAATDIKKFEAQLFNCVRYGPDSQNITRHPNFRAHLQGKLAHIIDVAPHKARKLIPLFDQINWNDDYPDIEVSTNSK